MLGNASFSLDLRWQHSQVDTSPGRTKTTAFPDGWLLLVTSDSTFFTLFGALGLWAGKEHLVFALALEEPRLLVASLRALPRDDMLSWPLRKGRTYLKHLPRVLKRSGHQRTHENRDSTRHVCACTQQGMFAATLRACNLPCHVDLSITRAWPNRTWNTGSNCPYHTRCGCGNWVDAVWKVQQW